MTVTSLGCEGAGAGTSEPDLGADPAHQHAALAREYYPAALEAFNDLDHSDALAVLGRGLTRTQIRAALRRGGRQRNLETRTEAIRTALRTDQLEAPAAVVEAFAAVTKAAVAVLGELNEQISRRN